MKKKIFLAFALCAMTMGSVFAQKNDTERMLVRYLSYVKIESQSDYPKPGSDITFPMHEGQKRMANYIYNEIKSFGKGVEVKISPDYYVYAKVPSNMKKKVPLVMFMAHLDVTPEANGSCIHPQVHRNYGGGDIVLGNGLVLSPESPQGKHLNDLKGKTIVTSDGSTLTGADCKTGCAILVTLMEQMLNDKGFKHGDVYFCFSQNEDIGMAADRMDLSYLDKVPDMLIDVDGGDYGQFSVSNFTAEGRTYLFKGNLAHPSNGKANSYGDARTAAAYFIGQLPPETHPSFSEGRQGYIHCYDGDTVKGNREDYRLEFRIRYFDKKDSAVFAGYLEGAMRRTLAAWPNVGIELAKQEIQYDNVANSMHPKMVEVIRQAAAKTGVKMEPMELRAGTTGAMMVAKGLPGGPCIYSGQQAEHSVYEWCCIEELVELTGLCKSIVSETSKLTTK